MKNENIGVNYSQRFVGSINFSVTNCLPGRGCLISRPNLLGNGTGSFTNFREIKRWSCANRIVNGRAVCDSHHINEDVLYATYHAAVKAMIEDAGVLLEVIQTETEVEMQPRNKAAMDEVEQQIIELQERVLDLHKQKRAMKISDAYYNAQVNDYSQQLGALESRKQALQTADARYATVRMWLADFRQHMQEGDATDERDGSIMKTLVEAIIVWDDRIEVRFKCGATVEQKYVE